MSQSPKLPPPFRESIAVTLDLPRGAEDTMRVHLAVQVDTATDELVASAGAAREAAADATRLTAEAVRRLRLRGLSIRDAAAIVGVTPGRVGVTPGRVGQIARNSNLADA